jgi:O-succinylbenzoate synthase
MPNLHLERLELREIELPLLHPFETSFGRTTRRRILLVRVFDKTGASGYGECVAPEGPFYNHETVDTAWLITARYIAPLLTRARVETAEEVNKVLAPIRGNQMAKAGVEAAIWDLEAKLAGRPLWRHLGGVRDEINCGVSIGLQDTTDKLVEKVGHELESGYQRIKIKIKPGKDVDFVTAVRKAFPAAPLMADANNAYTLDDSASLVAMDGLGLMMFEQPLAWDDIVRHAELQRRLNTPVCLDESITSLERAQDMVTLGAGRVINIKPGRVGGFASSIAIHDFCEANGIPVWCGGMLESGIGRSYNVALASLPNFIKPGDVSPSARYWARDIVTPEWTMEPDGTVRVPLDRPGIGVDVDVDRIEDITVRKEVISV